ncbi:MAG: 16S rRNA (uracil(1498)-N(3))-methyltransferase [Alphaproteobacteria bacterium]|nr:16S rRNA (uracil(1498)-N(3))-methyltransferase [Alphaproteobacteria bacterium]
MSEDLVYPGGKLRLFVDAALGQGARAIPGDRQTHYLLHVMRSKIGDRLSLFNGRDGEWSATVVEVSKRQCVLECRGQVAPQSDVPDLWLVFAPIKRTPADYVVQKATELGVRRLQPVITRRTIVHRVNGERMRANALEAAEQSGRLTVPDIAEPVPFARLLSEWPHGRRIVFCDEGGDARPIAEALRDQPSGPWAVVTGPEGGFDPGERAALRALPHVTPVSLGVRILRADTAALAALAVWQACIGEG